MNCPHCQFDNPANATRCGQCHVLLADVEQTISDGAASPAQGVAHLAAGVSSGALQVGTVLGNRYEILALLGEGGMGAVYKATDRELDRPVALKVIRPELASNPEILQRFKQELIFARKVTHKNVNRIFDLGEADGIKFITMEFVEGHDLKALLRQRGKFPVDEAVEFIRQICRALAAAHSEGIVHRDLKPHNILVDKQGKVLVTDFGLAHSVEMSGLTHTGALLGTPEYMSPEQAKGEKADERSDLFSLGLIFYELLTGSLPFKADSAYATLLKRTREVPAPLSKRDASIPQFMSDVVAKCLQIDPQRRYQKAIEILQDLEARQRLRMPSTVGRLASRLGSTSKRARLIFAIAAVLVAVGLATMRMLWRPASGPAKATVSLAIVPFQNVSADPSLDWLGPGLAEMLTTDVGQSPELRTVSSERLHQILRDLRIAPASSLDTPTLERIAEFSNADVVVWGKYAKLGDQIRIDASLHDLKSHAVIPLKADVSSESLLLEGISSLAKSIRDNLALSSEAREKMRATSFRPSTASLEALRDYNEGLTLAREGRHLEAAKKFESSISADPQFALAHVRLSQTYATLGYSERAEDYAQQAVDLSGNLPVQEKELIEAQHARTLNDLDRAIEAYQHLAESMPSDSQVLFELAALYEAKGELDKARELYTKILASDPKHLDALMAVARVERQSRNYESSLDYLNRALTLAVQVDNQESKARILQSMGINYKWLHKLDEALRYFQEALSIEEKIGDQRGMAATLDQIAQVYDRLGKPDLAKENYLRAVSVEREIGDKRGEAGTLLNLGTFYYARGRYDEALDSTKEALQLYTELGDQNRQALALNNIGAYNVAKGQLNDGILYYQRALQLRERLKIPGELAETHYSLADAYAQSGRYDEALDGYLRALELWRSIGSKEGVAVASNGMGTLFTYQGRFGAALSAQEEALAAIRELQQRDFWLGEILAGYGQALTLVGRTQEAEKPLQEALAVARELGNDPLVAKVLNYQGDRYFYAGDSKTARTLYQQAERVASPSQDRQAILLTKLNLAKVAAGEGRGQASHNTLRSLSREADELGLKYFSVECSLYAGEALFTGKQHVQARRELESTLRNSEKLHLRALQAKTHFLLAKVLLASGDGTAASRHSEKARQLLEEMRKEAGTDTLLRRADLKPLQARTPGA